MQVAVGAGGVITVQYGKSANANILGAQLIMTPNDNLGSVSWLCADGGGGPSGLLPKWLPAACR